MGALFDVLPVAVKDEPFATDKHPLSNLTIGYEYGCVAVSRIVLTDCVEWAKAAPENSIHAIVTDPPYGVKEHELDQIEKRNVGKGGVWKLRTQTRESRLFQEETREVAEGERIRFTRYDKEMGIRSGDLGTVTRLGQDNSITVKLDSGKTAEVSPEKSRHIDYGYAVDGLKANRAERIIATGDRLTQQVFQEASSRADQTFNTGTPAPEVQEFSAAKEISSPGISQPATQQHDFGIGF
ncbi:MAG: hypothetical protein ACRYFU_17440 [Janthinobacterium lividum]